MWKQILKMQLPLMGSHRRGWKVYSPKTRKGKSNVTLRKRSGDLVPGAERDQPDQTGAVKGYVREFYLKTKCTPNLILCF
jgi:hypothetical protein